MEKEAKRVLDLAYEVGLIETAMMLCNYCNAPIPDAEDELRSPAIYDEEGEIAWCNIDHFTQDGGQEMFRERNEEKVKALREFRMKLKRRM